MQKEDTEETRSLPDDELALEIGLNAHEYLEECFYNEVSVLDRDKFDAIPEIVKADLKILGHLGKGSFSDVFSVACDGPLGEEPGEEPPPPCGVPHAATISAAPKGVFRRASSGERRRGRPSARQGGTLGRSFHSRTTLLTPAQLGEPRRVYAMKCLRPQVRSDADQFTMGSEDLVHETAILANLCHEHIIRLHGRAAGHLTDAFVLDDGYFILLDALSETLIDRMGAWQVEAAGAPDGARRIPTERLRVARDAADAVVYLHSRRIVFRDLKPANVGFDGRGVLKLFDFGFAVGLPEPSYDNPKGLLHDRCGTPRYMAPEVGLSRGYGLPSDVYSFGILLWEMCALARPFADITSADEFDRAVFRGGARPAQGDGWPEAVRALMSGCWDAEPVRRPCILDVEASLGRLAAGAGGRKKSAMKSLRSSMTKRFSA